MSLVFETVKDYRITRRYTKSPDLNPLVKETILYNGSRYSSRFDEEFLRYWKVNTIHLMMRLFGA